MPQKANADEPVCLSGQEANFWIERVSNLSIRDSILPVSSLVVSAATERIFSVVNPSGSRGFRRRKPPIKSDRITHPMTPI